MAGSRAESNRSDQDVRRHEASGVNDFTESESGELKADDWLYHFDENELMAFRAAKPWVRDPYYFHTVQVSTSAAMKMISHAMSGVTKGMKEGGVPIEIMGLFIGRPCTTNRGVLIVSDSFPLPVNGTETRVLADDAEVVNFMIRLGESLELTRKDRFMGWYHSHPFDVGVHSHCFLSAMDIMTQLSWQTAEDGNGNPWLGLVIDPLRCLAHGKPEIGAFRAYPPGFSPPCNRTPDGTIVSDDKLRTELWGTSWHRYYQLKIEYRMTSLSAKLLRLVSERYLWTAAFSTTPMLDKNQGEQISERINGLCETLKEGIQAKGQHRLFQSTRSSSKSSKNALSKKDALSASAQISCDIASEHLRGQISQVVKYLLFSSKKY